MRGVLTAGRARFSLLARAGAAVAMAAGLAVLGAAVASWPNSQSWRSEAEFWNGSSWQTVLTS